jgi:hypothetical protein
MLFGVQLCRQPVKTGSAGHRTSILLHHHDSLPATKQQGSEGKQQKIGAVSLLNRNPAGPPSHRGRRVAPQASRLSRFPFRFSDEPALWGTATRLCRLPPVDSRQWIAGDESSKLPKTVTLSDTPTPMHALRHCRGNPVRGDQQGWQAGAESFGCQCIVGHTLPWFMSARALRPVRLGVPHMQSRAPGSRAIQSG